MLKGIVVGLGGRGLGWAVKANEHPGCAVVGYVEPSDSNRRRAAERLGIDETSIFLTLDDALGAVAADFIIDITPPAIHHVIAQTAFSAGLHVVGEKPLSDDYETARQTVQAGIAANRKHMITQNYRFGGQPRATRTLLADGLIGKPGQCDLRFYIPWADSPGTHYTTQPYMVINDMMVHHFDMMRYVLGADPERVHAITWNHPWGWHAGDAAHSIVFQYADGLVATHTACGCAVGSQTGWNGDWRIEGPLGTIDWCAGRTYHARLHRTDQRIQEEIPNATVSPSEQAILDEFFGAIRDGREPECSGRDNLRSLAMVFGAIRSAQEGRWVALSEFADAG